MMESHWYAYRSGGVTLCKSKKEIEAACKEPRKSQSNNASIAKIFGILSGKTNHVATLEEIERAIADGWAKESLERKR